MHNGPSNFMFGTAGFSFFAGLTLNEWAALVGIVVAVLGLAINAWHKWKIRQLEQRRLDFEMSRGPPVTPD